MKQLIALVVCLHLFVSCSGQKTKNNSGYYGSVKKVTQYTCPIKKYGVLPEDTSNFESRFTSSYDSLGNLMEGKSFYQYDNTILEMLTKYSGSEKNRTFTQKYLSGFDDTTERSYKYVYSDDYHYAIVPNNEVNEPSEPEVKIEYTLDKDFKTIKTVNKRGNVIQMIDEYNYKLRKSRVYEKTLKRTIKEGENDRVIHIVTVLKEFDSKGNPTVMHLYNDLDKKRLTNVVFIQYEYYDTEKNEKR